MALGLILLAQASIRMVSGRTPRSCCSCFAHRTAQCDTGRHPHTQEVPPGLPFPVSSQRASVPQAGPCAGHALLSFAHFRALIYIPAFALSYPILRGSQCIMAENGSLVESQRALFGLSGFVAFFNAKQHSLSLKAYQCFVQRKNWESTVGEEGGSRQKRRNLGTMLPCVG